MKFLIDAQISYKISKHFSQKGFDVIHVNQLPQRDRTPDYEIIKYAENQDVYACKAIMDTILAGTPLLTQA